MKDIVKKIDDRKYKVYNEGDIYILYGAFGEPLIKIYMLQFIVQLGENRFALASGTEQYNRKNFAIYTIDPVTSKIEREFGCSYYGRDTDNYETLLKRFNNMYCDNYFFLQGNNRLYIYDANNKRRIILKNIPNGVRIEKDDEDNIKVKTIARSQFDKELTDKVEFIINKEGLPITSFYSNLQDCYYDLLDFEETAEELHKNIEDITYEDVLNTTYCREIIYYLNNRVYTGNEKKPTRL